MGKQQKNTALQIQSAEESEASKAISCDPADGPVRLLFQPFGTRIHVVGQGGASPSAAGSVSKDAIAFNALQFPTDAATLAVQGDGAWTLRAPIELRKGKILIEHPAALAAVHAGPLADANTRVEFNSAGGIGIAVGGGGAALAPAPFAFAVGTPGVEAKPLAVDPKNSQLSMDWAGAVHSAAIFVVASGDVVNPAKIVPTHWQTRPLATFGAVPTAPPAAQRFGFAPAGGAETHAGNLVYIRSDGTTRFRLAPL